MLASHGEDEELSVLLDGARRELVGPPVLLGKTDREGPLCGGVVDCKLPQPASEIVFEPVFASRGNVTSLRPRKGTERTADTIN